MVSYKKIETNTLMGSIQLGIQAAIGGLTKYAERDLLMQDFMTGDVDDEHSVTNNAEQLQSRQRSFPSRAPNKPRLIRMQTLHSGKKPEKLPNFPLH